MIIVTDSSGSYGYVWTLNYTLTKRWKSSVTLDQDAIRKLVKDLCRFCENGEGELTDFFKSFTAKCQDNSAFPTQEKSGNDMFERVLETFSDE